MSQPAPLPVHHLASRLQPAQADIAFTLASQAFPQMSSEQWRRFVAEVMASDEADGPIIYVIKDLRGYIKGLCICQPTSLPPYGRLLDIDPFVVFELADSGKLARSLLLTLEHHARSKNCKAMRIASPLVARPASAPADPFSGEDLAGSILPRRLLSADHVSRAIYALPGPGDGLGAHHLVEG